MCVHIMNCEFCMQVYEPFIKTNKFMNLFNNDAMKASM